MNERAGQEAMNRVSNKCPNIGDLRVSRIEGKSPQGDVQEGQRLMIIELKSYNKIRALLIETGITW